MKELHCEEKVDMHRFVTIFNKGQCPYQYTPIVDAPQTSYQGRRLVSEQSITQSIILKHCSSPSEA